MKREIKDTRKLFVFYTVKCRIFTPQNALLSTITGLFNHTRGNRWQSREKKKHTDR